MTSSDGPTNRCRPGNGKNDVIGWAHQPQQSCKKRMDPPIAAGLQGEKRMTSSDIASPIAAGLETGRMTSSDGPTNRSRPARREWTHQSLQACKRQECCRPGPITGRQAFDGAFAQKTRKEKPGRRESTSVRYETVPAPGGIPLCSQSCICPVRALGMKVGLVRRGEDKAGQGRTHSF